MLTLAILEAHKDRLLKNKQTALQMLHNVQGALAMIETLITNETQGSAEPSSPHASD